MTAKRHHSTWASVQVVNFIKALKAHVVSLVGDDEQAIRDTIEGEVDLDGLVSGLLEERAILLAEAVALKALAAARTEAARDKIARAERIESLIAEGLRAASQDQVKVVNGTCSIVAGGLSVEVTDEAIVPFEYFKPKLETGLLRTALLNIEAKRKALEERKAEAERDGNAAASLACIKAMEALQPIPGAQLKRGVDTLQIRSVKSKVKGESEKEAA